MTRHSRRATSDQRPGRVEQAFTPASVTPVKIVIPTEDAPNDARLSGGICILPLAGAPHIALFDV
ncbi:MAG TPA: hypothetical protein VF493_19200 [Terriglobales bacterium]